MSYTIERLNSETLEKLIPLYKASFNLDLTLPYLKKRFDTSAFGLSYVGYIAFDENQKSVAYYGVFPCKLTSNNSVYLVAQLGDTMTHPNHQGKGLFVSLAKQSYDLAKENGVQLVYGFPNANSYPGFIRKLNWVDKEAIVCHTIKVKTLPLAKATGRLKWLSKPVTAWTEIFFKKYIVNESFLSNSVLDDEYAGILHDEAFFNYKRFSKKLVLNVNGKKLWVKIDTRLWIGDMERCSLTELKSIIEILKQPCLFSGISEIRYFCSPESYFDSLFKQISFSERKDLIRDCYLNLGLQIDPQKIRFTGADSDTF